MQKVDGGEKEKTDAGRMRHDMKAGWFCTGSCLFSQIEGWRLGRSRPSSMFHIRNITVNLTSLQSWSSGKNEWNIDGQNGMSSLAFRVLFCVGQPRRCLMSVFLPIVA